MFKSVFTKYLAIFMLLITCSFLILALIISSIANDYAINTKEEGITRTSNAVANFLVRDFEGESAQEFSNYLKNEKENLDSVLTASLFYTDTCIFIIDNTGAPICTDLKTGQNIISGTLPQTYLDKLNDNEQILELSNLGEEELEPMNIVTPIDEISSESAEEDYEDEVDEEYADDYEGEEAYEEDGNFNDFDD